MSNQFEGKLEDLKCPLTLDLLEDPIATPCCGKCISRQPFIDCHNLHRKCPLCNQDLNDLNPMSLPTVKNIAYLCEQAKQFMDGKSIDLFSEPKITQSDCRAKLYCLSDDSRPNSCMIGKLEIQTNIKNFNTLLIPVLDKSGSMAGNPIIQCKYSMERIVDITYQYKHLITHIVTYDDTASSFHVDTKMNIEFYKEKIRPINASGGTSFTSAFNEIASLLDKHKDNQIISSAIVIFLTDGEDSQYTKQTRSKLIDTLKSQITQIWSKDFVIHTIGFGSNHDFDFLNNLRNINKEGAYRYADPSENSDILSTKLNEVLQTVSSNVIVPIKILRSDLQIICGEYTNYWANLKYDDFVNERHVVITIDDKEYDLIIEIDDDKKNDKKIWDEWISLCIDNIFEELNSILPEINAENMKLEIKIHLKLLEKRIDSMMTRLEKDSLDYERCSKILEILNNGISIDKKKLIDLKFMAKFNHADKLSCNVKSVQKDTVYYPKVQFEPKYSYNFVDKTRIQRFIRSDDIKSVVDIIGCRKNDYVKKYIDNHIDEMEKICDPNNSSIIKIVSAIGRINILEHLLTLKIDINKIDKTDRTALDCAIIFGYNKTADLLLKNGGKINCDAKQLFLTCINNKYFRTADVMIKYNLITPEENMTMYFSHKEQIEFISHRLKCEVSLETAILKGIVHRVEELLPIITKLSWKPYREILENPSDEHIQIIKLLIENDKIDPLEIFDISVKYDDGTVNDEITWSLFIACKRGRYALYCELVKYYDTPELLNRQNTNGNTVLWIASDGGHIDIVSELIGLGVDVNIQNTRGDTALRQAIQKGFSSIVDVLLDHGADLDVYDKSRDNPIILCCRCGQANIMEILLKYDTSRIEYYMTSKAGIDGFDPLHASTEVDKLECIKMCVKYGANLESKTDDDNEIIKGATSLHLACWYGRLHSVMVLVSLGADVKSVTNIENQTPLHIAIIKGHIQIVRFLLTIKKGIECLEIKDVYGRLPAYYAQAVGNDKIFEEFFENKLEKIMMNVLVSDSETEKKCCETIINFGITPLCYEYDDIIRSENIMVMAILNNNRCMLDCLLQIDRNNQMKSREDEFGISPLFWLRYLNIIKVEDEKTNNMIVKMNQIVKLNIQNKLLCDIKPNTLKVFGGGKMINMMDRQNDGIDIKIDDHVIEELAKSAQVTEYPMMGFIEKLKQRVFCGNDTIHRYVIMDAKYNVVKRLLSDEIKLTPAQIMAIYLYTGCGEIYKQINQSLKDLNKSNFWYPYINTLYQAVKSIPPYVGETYKAIDKCFDLDKYKIGQTIRWNYFSMTSGEYKTCAELIEKRKGMSFIIHSKTGRHIGKYSKNAVDNEIIFLPNTEFLVKDIFAPNVICLGQPNIRKTTFKIKEKDIEKAVNGTACIIIELEEI